MKSIKRLFVLGAGLAVILHGFLGCSGDSKRSEPKVECSTYFVPPDHKASSCLKELLPAVESSDSVIFNDKSSKIRVLPPRLPRNEQYHCHLYQRLGQELLEHVFYQDGRGLIEIDLAKYPDPEQLVVTSAARRLAEKESVKRSGSSGVSEARPDEGVMLPYTLSFRIVSADIAPTVLSLQRNRYDIETPQGVVSLVVGSFNRRDQILTWIDPSRKVWPLFTENPEITLPKYKSVVPPRITVEVFGPDDKIWQRSGTFHLPEGIDRLSKPDEKPYVFRAQGRDVISFAPPPRVELVLPENPPTTEANIKAKFTGVTEREGLRFVLACAYPVGGPGRQDYEARVQTHDVTAKTKEGTFTTSLAHLEGSRFPLTASIYHHLSEPWVLTGGRYNPEAPRGKVVLGQKIQGSRGPSYALGAIYSSHYDFLEFFGAASKGKRGSSLVEDYWNAPDGSSPNVAPPPGGGPGVPPLPPPGGDPLPIPLPPGAGGGNIPGGFGGLPPGGPPGGGPNPPAGDIWVRGPDFHNRFKCPDGGCLSGKKDCNCAPHSWSYDDLQAQANARANPKPCDVTWRGHDPLGQGPGVQRNGPVPCDGGEVFIGYMDLMYWIKGTQRKVHNICWTYVQIGGCVRPPPHNEDGKDDKPKTTQKSDSDKPQDGGGRDGGKDGGGDDGATTFTTRSTETTQTTYTQTTFTFTQTTFGTSQVRNGPGGLDVNTYGYMDPNTQGLTSDAGLLAGGSPYVSSSMIIPTGWLTADSFTLTNIAQGIQADQASAQNAYWGRNDGTNGSGPWNEPLYTGQAGILNPVKPGVITPTTTTPPGTTTGPSNGTSGSTTN